ncbi:MAG: transglutaminase domain-containing protein [Phycisphaeraceae bacterium]|nr:transglutaminase domain-containing protein [Phycisphaeraceae bacterium]
MKRILLALIVLFLFPALLRAESTDFERWYVVMLQGQRVGHMHSSTHTVDQNVITREQMALTLRRGPSAVSVEQSMSFIETLEGRPVIAETMLRTAQQPLNSRYTFNDDGISIEREMAGRSMREQVPPLAGEYLTPAAAQRRIEQLDKQGADQIQLAMLDVSTGQPAVIAVAMTRIGQENIEVLGKTVPAEVWDVTSTATGGLTIRQYVDDRGQMLRSTIAIMGMTLDILAADEAVATSAANPPEVVASLLVQPDQPISNPRQLRRSLFKLLLPDDFNADLPRAGYQRVTWADDHTVLVALDLDQPVAPTDDQPTPDNLAASSVLDYQSEPVQALLAKALGDDAKTGSDPVSLSNADKAERLRTFVHQYVASKNLSVGFAAASEVARTAEGDCTEHAVLLAALLRAANIPSRTVTGLIYVDDFLGRQNAFGYHMWTQAWLTPAPGSEISNVESRMSNSDHESAPHNDSDSHSPGKTTSDAPENKHSKSEIRNPKFPSGGGGARWVDLDATLDDPFDAAHITLAVSAMQEGSLFTDMLDLLPLLGGLKIEVLEQN